MKTNVQILAIWSIIMLLIPAGAIYFIDNYETGIVRGVVKSEGIGLFSSGYVNSLNDGGIISTTDRDDLDWYWGSVNVDDTYWDTLIYGPYPFFSSSRCRNSVSTIGNENLVVNNYTGFGASAQVDIVHWTDITAYELAEVDAVALNLSILNNLSDLDNDVWIFASDSSSFVDIFAEHIRVDNHTIMWTISLDDKTDLLALSHDARVWIGIAGIDQITIYDWSLEMLTFETQFGIDPMTAYGVVLLLIIVTTIYTTLLATPIVGLTIKKSG